MTLAETYALQCGLAIDKPYISKKFYPLPTDFSKVILIHAGGGNDKFPSKVYDHYDEVISLLKPIVEPLGYVFYQIGGKGEERLREANYLCGTTSIAQTAYLLNNAALFIGNDSMNSHIRGSFKKPSITLFGPTSAREHGPYWNYANTVCLESHKSGKKHSFSAMEQIKTINFIAPETVGNKALELLGIPQRITEKTLYIGDTYRDMIIEIVPDHVPNPRFLKDNVFTVRMDYLYSDTAIREIASTRKISIITKQPLDLAQVIEYKHNITSVIQEVDENTDINYIEKVRRTGVKFALFCREKDEKKFADIRFKFYDFFYIEQFYAKTKEDFLKQSATFLNTELDNNLKIEDTWFKSNKFLLSDGKIYLSKAHYFAEQATPTFTEHYGKVIDTPDFWMEQDNMLFYKK